MNRKILPAIWPAMICAVFLFAAACSKQDLTPKLIVEIPSGFSGDFLLEMGVKDAPPLDKRGEAYVVPVPRNGKVITSTLLTTSQPTFQNSSGGTVWGYAHSVFKTGDGIPVGGKIEFFVGTRKEYEAEQNKKNHSGGVSMQAESRQV
ncbi:MAG TPA: hypothetical protein VH350_03470 [Candidatus Sulfotelmatobacter sp.]|nr:hypothetical protein [Candidatus Sulfotelmatobacter sp.]